MDISFKGTQYDLPEQVTERTSSKLQAIRKYLGGYDDTTHVYVELGKETNAHQSGEIWFASATVASNGENYMAKAVEENIDNAVDRMIDELSKEIRRSKEKDRSLFRKGGLAIKNMMRGMRS